MCPTSFLDSNENDTFVIYILQQLNAFPVLPKMVPSGSVVFSKSSQRHPVDEKEECQGVVAVR